MGVFLSVHRRQDVVVGFPGRVRVMAAKLVKYSLTLQWKRLVPKVRFVIFWFSEAAAAAEVVSLCISCSV